MKSVKDQMDDEGFGLGEAYDYLGHFGKDENLERGHNFGMLGFNMIPDMSQPGATGGGAYKGGQAMKRIYNWANGQPQPGSEETTASPGSAGDPFPEED